MALSCLNSLHQFSHAITLTCSSSTLSHCLPLSHSLTTSPKQPQNYDNSNAVKCLVLSSEGHKGFCAGGDIKTLHGTRTEPGQHTAEQRQFFWAEYNLNHLIHSLSTTYIAIMDGITMGGGVGLSVHGPIRVAT